jgi:hypothetical protein
MGRQPLDAMLHMLRFPAAHEHAIHCFAHQVIVVAAPSGFLQVWQAGYAMSCLQALCHGDGLGTYDCLPFFYLACSVPLQRSVLC